MWSAVRETYYNSVAVSEIANASRSRLKRLTVTVVLPIQVHVQVYPAVTNKSPAPGTQRPQENIQVPTELYTESVSLPPSWPGDGNLRIDRNFSVRKLLSENQSHSHSHGDTVTVTHWHPRSVTVIR
jgi:hypothetical protein